MTKFSTSFKASNKPSKQRLYGYNAPLHLQGKMLSAHLSKELRTKLKTRSMRVRVGDKVIVMIGQYKKKSGKVESTDVRGRKVYIAGIDRLRKDGSKAQYPFDPSNLVIIEMADDKRRLEAAPKKAPQAKSQPVKKTEAKKAPVKGGSQ